MQVKGFTKIKTALQDTPENEVGEDDPITDAGVEVALNVVATTVFPHRALEIQRLWMNCRMFKPVELTTRQTSAVAINRLNNALPLFPGGSELSKFSESQVVELLEWSLPPTWRAKFDLDGYIPTLGSKMKLIEACETIERNETTTADKEDNKKGKKGKGEKPKNENSFPTQKKVRERNTNIFVPSMGTTLRIVPAIAGL